MRALFDYCSDSGVLTRKADGRNEWGTCGQGYCQVFINRRPFRLHRIAWVRQFGAVPAGAVIDHINGDILDNRIVNLRLATRHDNARNAARPRNNTSGFKGVSRRRGRFRAYIRADGHPEHLGWFSSAENAARAYDAAAVRLFGNFARTNAVLGLL